MLVMSVSIFFLFAAKELALLWVGERDNLSRDGDLLLLVESTDRLMNSLDSSRFWMSDTLLRIC